MTNIKNGARPAAMAEALRKLVALKDMKDRLEQLHAMGHGTDYTLYHEQQPLAWAAAREALAALAQPSVEAPAAVEVSGWREISSAPRDGTPIIGWCVHSADSYYVEHVGCLTDYGARVEGLSHVEDGPHVLVWGESYEVSDGWESPTCTIPPTPSRSSIRAGSRCPTATTT